MQQKTTLGFAEAKDDDTVRDQPWLAPSLLSTPSHYRFSGLVYVWIPLETNQGRGSFLVKLQTSSKTISTKV